MVKIIILDFLFKIRGTNYKREYFEIKNLDNKKKLKEFQQEALTNLLLHAYQNVPYYTHIFDEIGIVKNSNTCDLSKFNQIPILTKDKIKNNFQALTSKDHKKRKSFYFSSGGTSGEPFTFILDITYQKWNKATSQYYENMIGINKRNAKKIYLWGAEKDIFTSHGDLKAVIQNWLTNTKVLNSFNMNEENMKKYVQIINTFKPKYIIGYANSLNDLCQYIKNNKYKIFTPKVIISSAEKLRDDMRKKIEKVFGTKVVDLYGSREVACLAGECMDGLIHIFSFNNLIEILDENNQPVKNNQEGRVIVTNLHNYSMPFIRYEIGDMALPADTKCKCGNPLPTLKKITGRTLEHFLREDGSIVPAEFFMYLFGAYYKKETIRKYQVIQEDYKKIKIFIVPKGNISEPEKKDFEDKIRVAMGTDIEIVWEFVNDIPKTKSGKHLYVIANQESFASRTTQD
jgi:phenylacetate-CoA ligase